MASFDNLYNKALSASQITAKPKAVHVRYGDAVYHFSVPLLRKWAEYHYEPQLVPKIGKKVFVGFQGDWHRHPINFSAISESMVPQDLDNKDMRIIQYESINANKKSANEIRIALEDRRTEKKNDMRHFKAMLAESKRTKWPSSYATDLEKHDKRELSYRSPDLPVGWILRDSGTHLVFPEKKYDGSDSHPGKRNVRSMKESFGLDACRFYAWDGTALRHMQPEMWAEWIDKQHRYLTGESHSRD